MEQRELGAGGPMVSAVGLGCMSFAGAYGAASEDESFATLDAAYEAGITFYDTANIYGMGRSEEILGRWMAARRPQGIVLASKAGIIPGPPRGVNNQEAYLRAELEGSLRRLGVERIDLFYMHRRDSSVPVEDLAGTYKRLMDEGKIGGYGLSECAPSTLRAAHREAPCRAVQSEYSLWTRQPELGMIEACLSLGVAFVPFSPLGRGILTDHPLDPQSYAAGDFRRRNPRFQDGVFAQNMALIAPFRAFAAELGVPAATLAMAWVLARGEGRMIPIPGTRSVAHLKELLASVTLRLTADDLARIEAILPAGFAVGARYAADQTTGVEDYC